MKILTVLGTRPEAIKLAPFFKSLAADKSCSGVLCTTTQHREMQNSILSLFDITSDHDLDIMKEGQDLFYITNQVLAKIPKILEIEKPDFVVVQGDTTTAFAAALASFYKTIPVVHIEAGLRTSDIYSPFPEEMNRVLISKLANMHFAPTQKAFNNLKNEGITENVFNVGNTIVDSVDWVLKQPQTEDVATKKFLERFSKKVLITVHRRESFGEPLKRICQGIKAICCQHPEIGFVWPVHPNPNVRGIVYSHFEDLENVHLTSMLSYEKIVHMINKSDLILSDSGGIQEEAIILNKPILILREKTERPEVVETGLGVLVGFSEQKIMENFSKFILGNEKNKLNNGAIYGLPGVSLKILDEIKKWHYEKTR